MVGVGVIGYGYAGRVFHCPLIAQAEGLRLAAICSRDPQRREQARQQWNVRVYAQPEELLADEQVHLVVIATPHNTHHALGKLALQAGKHVVVDKPFTITTTEADDLITEARERALLLSVFHNRRWDWDYLTVRKVIEQELLGEVWQVESCVGRYGHSSRWRARRDSMGSLLHDWGAHLVDQAIQLMGLPHRVMAWRHFRVWQNDVESFIRAVLDYGEARTFAVEVNYLRAVERPRWYVLGDKGGLVKYGLDPQEKALIAGDITQAQEPPDHHARLWLYDGDQITEHTVESVRGDWREYYRNIAAVLLQGAELAVKPEEAREVIRVIEAALLSAETGEVVIL
ncbi:MAG: Gfo/Idh/MocA family oxidoreductase [Armatimonadota bacterium]|nr:Gfo/Idh/MocA family oxidoreductase [bacterium]MDW8321477.1 Gfo/Idh/MocA family oxidoreductase [Armatimonadota bacterium]